MSPTRGNTVLKRRSLGDLSPFKAKRRRTEKDEQPFCQAARGGLTLGSDDSEADCNAVEAQLTIVAERDAASTDTQNQADFSSVASYIGKRRTRPAETASGCTRPLKVIRRFEQMVDSSDDLPSSETSDGSASSPAFPRTPTGIPLRHEACRIVVDDDPPSDDLTMFDSPSKSALSRKLSRSNSFSRLSTLPLSFDRLLAPPIATLD